MKPISVLKWQSVIGQPERRRHLLIITVLLAVSLPSLSQTTRTVNVGQGGTNFVDQVSNTSTTTINEGDTVHWVWQSGPHSTTSGTCSGPATCTGDGRWDSTQHNVPFTYDVVFNFGGGTFPYYCSVHLGNMTGKVIVQPVVINTNDSGAGSLRQAILDFNADPDLTQITFNIPGGGVHTITPLSALPAITKAFGLLDGTSQPGWAPGNPVIELDGASAGVNVNGITIQAAGTKVRGFIINRFSQAGIAVEESNNTVTGNFIGTNAAGTAALGNSIGVWLPFNDNNNTIGGNTLADRNVISGNATGVWISQGRSNSVVGNFIGTDATGSSALANTSVGVQVDTSSGNYVGNNALSGEGNVISGNAGVGVIISGTGSNFVDDNFIGLNAAGTAALGNGGNGVSLGTDFNGVQGNVISGNAGAGISIFGSHNSVTANLIGTNVAGNAPAGNGSNGVYIQSGTSNMIGNFGRNIISGNQGQGVLISGSNSKTNLVQGNYIGTDISGVSPIGNTGDGVRIDTGAANNTTSGNRIAFNAKGVVVTGSSTTVGNAIEGNTIFFNTGLGMDLNDDGVTLNTPGGPHSGPNNLQNYPVLTSAVLGGGATSVTGTLNSTPNTAFHLEFFENPACDSSGHGQGQNSLGTTTVTTDGSGNAVFSASTSLLGPGSVSATATATDPAGNTSEFSACQPTDYALSNAAGRNLRVRLGQPFTLVVASFTDTDPSGSAGQFTGTTIDWGDGTAPTTAAQIVSLGSQNYNVIGTHAYTKVGAWTVTVTINDSGGATATATSNVRLWPKPLSY